MSEQETPAQKRARLKQERDSRLEQKITKMQDVLKRFNDRLVAQGLPAIIQQEQETENTEN